MNAKKSGTANSCQRTATLKSKINRPSNSMRISNSPTNCLRKRKKVETDKFTIQVTNYYGPLNLETIIDSASANMVSLPPSEEEIRPCEIPLIIVHSHLQNPIHTPRSRIKNITGLSIPTYG